MTQVERLAAWIGQATYADLSEEAREALKIHVLDALGGAIGAIDGPPMQMLRAQLEEFGSHPLVTLIGGERPLPTGPRCITPPWYATWTIMTAFLRSMRPAIPVTIWGRC